MQLNKKIFHTLLTSTLLATTLSALDIQAIGELKYSIADGKAKSYSDTANNTTHAPLLGVGVQLQEYNTRILLNYKPIRWKDADADLISLNLDYIFKASQNIDLFVGGGMGTMSLEAQNIKETKTVYTMHGGLNYAITESFYATAGINYLNTNNLGIEKSQFLYAHLENMLSVEMGIGFRFGFSQKTTLVQELHSQADKIEMPLQEQEKIGVEIVEVVEPKKVAKEEMIEQIQEQIPQKVEQTMEAIEAPRKAIVQASSLHVRPTPDKNNPPVGWLQNNQIVEIQSCTTDGWCKLVEPQGFVSERFIFIE
jgi:hypothetical protein